MSDDAKKMLEQIGYVVRHVSQVPQLLVTEFLSKWLGYEIYVTERYTVEVLATALHYVIDQLRDPTIDSDDLLAGTPIPVPLLTCPSGHLLVRLKTGVIEDLEGVEDAGRYTWLRLHIANPDNQFVN
jgi:hypothetical protein